MMDIIPSESLEHLTMTTHGLVVDGEPTESEWEQAGQFLARADRSLQWLIGDWYNKVPWGDKKAACERVGLDYATARTYAAVASKFEMSIRIDNCSFAHHRIAAPLEGAARDKALEKAADGDWSERRRGTEPRQVAADGYMLFSETGQ
jgi:hypothetical protein